MFDYTVNFFTKEVEDYQWENCENDNFRNGIAAQLFYQMKIHKDVVSIICD